MRSVSLIYCTEIIRIVSLTTSNNFQIFFFGVLALIALTSAKPEPEPETEPEPYYGVRGSYYQNAWRYPAMECDQATCMICNEVHADNGPIRATNCHYQCRQCALCGEAKGKGLFNEVAKCEKYCAGGISACTRNCLQGQQKCLACAPQCGKY